MATLDFGRVGSSSRGSPGDCAAATASGASRDSWGLAGPGRASVNHSAKGCVHHFIGNAQFTLPDGRAVSIHQEDQFILNANGIPVVTRTTATCG
jgi:hypothetical protein